MDTTNQIQVSIDVKLQGMSHSEKTEYLVDKCEWSFEDTVKATAASVIYDYHITMPEVDHIRFQSLEKHTYKITVFLKKVTLSIIGFEIPDSNIANIKRLERRFYQIGENIEDDTVLDFDTEGLDEFFDNIYDWKHLW